jgi:hypothetical protein
MIKQIDIARKFIFQIDKIILESNPSSSSGFGNAIHDADMAESSGDVWQLISLLNGVIGTCLVSSLCCS